MNPPLRRDAGARNPIARSLASALLGVALAGAALLGAVLFAILLAVYAVSYVVSLAYSSLRLNARRRRAAFVEAAPKAAPESVLDAEYEVVEVAADGARRRPNGTV